MHHYNVKTNFAPPHNITYTDNNNEKITDMSSNYPYVLTPPMDLNDLQSVSGGNSPHQVYASPFYGGMFDTADEPNSGVQPYLTIVEQPSDRFRFRYKSEMAGTHGSLTGKNSDKARKQTYPTVQLHNCKIPAVIRCSLYQYSREDMIHTRQPHAHRLVKKQGTEEIDDPHNIHVNIDESYTATFHSMGIIHTAKKNIVSELEKKNRKLKLEEIARNDGICRPLSKKEEQEVRVMAERESKTINLNIVCLRFDAYKVVNNIYRPICNPVYSSPINNLKSALTGDLKIVRMDHFTSPSRGGKEIFILVEKVTKKNIKVRLYELDDDDKEIWSDYGRFTDLDVHHQYAIVFKTPPYKVLDIETEAKVFIELQRPSDGARSEPKDFTYIPTKIMHNRKRTRYESSSISSCNMSSGELPITINYLGDNQQCNLYGTEGNNLVNSEELTEALKNNDIDSVEFDKLCQFMLNSEPGIYDITSQEGFKSLVLDAPEVMDCSVVKSEIPCPREVVGYSLKSLNRKEVEIVSSFKEQLISFIKTKPSKERMSLMLDRLFEDSINSDTLETVLHLLVAENDQKLLLLLLKLLFRYQETNLVNLQNRKGQTALHLAVESHNSIALQFLIYTKADVTIRDLEGNNVLHIAVMGNAPIRILKLLCLSPEIRTCIDHINYDGFTALHLAVEANNLIATKMLCWNHANVNIGHKKTGDTALHMAITGHSFDIVKFLLDNTDADVHQKNYRQHSPTELAKLTIEGNSPQTNLINQLFDCAIKSEQFSEEIDIKEEDIQVVSDDDTVIDDDIDIEEEGKMEFEIKSERSGLSTMDVKEEQVTYEYTDVKELSEECLNRVSELLTLSNNWISLAELLGHDHLISVGIITSPKTLFHFAMRNGDKILEIRNFLEDLDEIDAVKCIDNMMIRMSEQKK